MFKFTVSRNALHAKILLKRKLIKQVIIGL